MLISIGEGWRLRSRMYCTVPIYISVVPPNPLKISFTLSLAMLSHTPFHLSYRNSQMRRSEPSA